MSIFKEMFMYARVLKRLLDFLIGLIALPFLLIVTLVLAPIIVIDDKGPVFYNALRLGKNGKPFKMYKFRSMMVNAPDIRNEDGSTYNGDDDPRVTKIGRFMRKTSIDELSQFLNVLLGDEIIVKMAEAGVACNVHYKPLPMMTAYKNMGFDIKDYPNAYKRFENEITLPLHTKLTDEEVNYVIEQFSRIVKEYI